MNFMMRANFSLPFEAKDFQLKKIWNLIAGKKLLRLATSDRLVSVMGGCESEVAGFADADGLGRGIQQILDCDVRASVHVTPVGERVSRAMEFTRKPKAPRMTLVFSGRCSQRGSFGEFALSADGKVLAFEKGFALPSAQTGHEAAYDALDAGLMRTLEYCTGAGIEPSSVMLTVVSTAELVIKQLGSRAPIDDVESLDRVHRCSLLLNGFDRTKTVYQLARAA